MSTREPRQGIRRCVEVSSREMEIDGRVRQIGVAQQELDRPQVGARFQQMGRVRVPTMSPGT